MSVKDQVLQLPKKERLIVMEALWESLTSNPTEFESPDWHKDVLAETQKRYESGEEVSIDWAEAKKKLKS